MCGAIPTEDQYCIRRRHRIHQIRSCMCSFHKVLRVSPALPCSRCRVVLQYLCLGLVFRVSCFVKRRAARHASRWACGGALRHAYPWPATCLKRVTCAQATAMESATGNRRALLTGHESSAALPRALSLLAPTTTRNLLELREIELAAITESSIDLIDQSNHFVPRKIHDTFDLTWLYDLRSQLNQSTFLMTTRNEQAHRLRQRPCQPQIQKTR